MRLKPLLALLKWVLCLGLVGGLLYGGYLIHTSEKEEGANSERTPAPPRVKDGVVIIDDEVAERYDIALKPAQPVQWYEQVTVYGRVVANPRATTEIRSPFAGTLRGEVKAPWPRLGQLVQADQLLGWVDIRIGPELRTDLQNKLAEARIKQQGAEEEVKLQESRVKSLREVTTQAILPRTDLDLALIHLAQTRTQLATAKAAAELWQKALNALGRRPDEASPWSEPLRSPATGEVTELASRPGMTIEAGTLLAQLVDFRRPLVRLNLPPELLLAGPPPQVEFFAPAATPPPLSGILQSPRLPRTVSPLKATLVGPAPRLDEVSQWVGYWYEGKEESTHPVNKTDLWRPGLQVRASVKPAKAQPLPAIAIPAGALLYHEGRALVYVRIAAEKYQHREVRLLGREGDRWIVLPRQGDLLVGVAAGEQVVYEQAQILLSEEFRGTGGDND